MKNVGRIDQIIRVIIGIGVLSLLLILPGDARWWGLIGLIPLVTGIIGYCPLYSLLRISTRKK